MSAGSTPIPGDKTSDLAPKLSRARVYPGTQAIWDDKTTTGGRTSPTTSSTSRSRSASTPRPRIPPPAPAPPARSGPTTSTAASTNRRTARRDDWMYNGEANTDPALFADSNLYYIRLSTLARTDRRDKDYQAPTLVRVEDNKYDKPETTVSTPTRSACIAAASCAP